MQVNKLPERASKFYTKNLHKFLYKFRERVSGA